MRVPEEWPEGLNQAAASAKRKTGENSWAKCGRYYRVCVHSVSRECTHTLEYLKKWVLYVLCP